VPAVAVPAVAGDAAFILHRNLTDVKVLSTASHYGDIYSARYKGRRVVVKVSKGRAGFNELSEMTTLANLSRHPNLVTFLGLCPDFAYANPQTQEETKCNVLCLVLEFVTGSNAEAFFGDGKRPDNLFKWCLHIARGLQHLHKSVEGRPIGTKLVPTFAFV